MCLVSSSSTIFRLLPSFNCQLLFSRLPRCRLFVDRTIYSYSAANREIGGIPAITCAAFRRILFGTHLLHLEGLFSVTSPKFPYFSYYPMSMTKPVLYITSETVQHHITPPVSFYLVLEHKAWFSRAATGCYQFC